MKGPMRFSITAAMTCMLAAALSAQQGRQTGAGDAGRPHWKADWTIHGAHIVMEYGRPYLKKRPEAQMMPLGEPWRTGADQATTITSDKPLTFGTIKLAAGTTYTVNTQSGAKDWQFIIGKLGAPDQWGIPYKPELEIGRAPMSLGKTQAPVEQVTFSADATASGGVLRLEWGTTSVTIPFSVG